MTTDTARAFGARLVALTRTETAHAGQSTEQPNDAEVSDLCRAAGLPRERAYRIFGGRVHPWRSALRQGGIPVGYGSWSEVCSIYVLALHEDPAAVAGAERDLAGIIERATDDQRAMRSLLADRWSVELTKEARGA